MSKTFFIDTTRCTACRGCQVACKEWHGLPGTKTKQWGSHQNPVDLNAFTFKLVRFTEHEINGKVTWNFFPDQCRHCLEPPCREVADGYLPGAIISDDATGAIIYTDKTKRLSEKAFNEIRESCPYNIPRRDEKTKAITKCDIVKNFGVEVYLFYQYSRIRVSAFCSAVSAGTNGPSRGFTVHFVTIRTTRHSAILKLKKNKNTGWMSVTIVKNT